MKYCSNCGNKINQNNKFCSSCGCSLKSNSYRNNKSLTINNPNDLTLDSIETTWNWGAFQLWTVYLLVYRWKLGLGMWLIVIVSDVILYILFAQQYLVYLILSFIVFYSIGIYFGLHGEEIALNN